ncbi:hypothetical protein [Herpetosiphon geysericola]|uniref:C2H2-type domain-containing protein n=1 Tax=Herpetosiphon geysericola TaxID=70996 RepID=A0A0P6XJL2_9CHLR|nr:hypothetical protein [Herpetosiphon geysericola]KPL80245.1 hypothetical protein SE18_24635 [Herpetosiphon geysericola]
MKEKTAKWYCSNCCYIAATIEDYKAHKATHATTGETHYPQARPGALIELPIVAMWQRATTIVTMKLKKVAA